MAGMTSRERVLRTLRFEETDRAPYDLMESIVWPELQQWFSENMGLADADAVRDYFDLDFRWFWPLPQPPDGINLLDPKYNMPYTGDYSDSTLKRPLSDVATVDEMLDKHAWMDPRWWDFDKVRDLRALYPDKAIIILVHYTMLFMNACDFFGMEEAMLRLISEDEVLLEFIHRQNDFALAMTRSACRAGEGVADICWCMDDVASQRALMMRPELWRRFFKEPLRQQVAVMHDHGLRAMFHSCGAIREILPDLIEIGFDIIEPFQTTADGMDAASVARDFGGHATFYGGIDIQQLLTFGTEEEVRAEVRANLDRFAGVGGYVVANSHHCVANINPRNICGMLDEAGKPHSMGHR